MPVLPDVFPSGTAAELFALTADAERTYFLNQAGEVWLFDRARKTSARITSGSSWDLAVSPARDAIAYARSGTKRTEQYVWVSPLDPKTGLGAGPERRVSPNPGDVPSISPDGKWVAFARDDPSGVGQSIVVVAVAGGAERVVVPSVASSVDHIRWTPDGQSLYFGVNPPVPCVPDWSCLPLPRNADKTVATIRRVAVAGGPVTIVATGRSASPGLSPDGMRIAYGDAAGARQLAVADANGRRLGSFVLSGTQAVSGWLSGSTLLVRSAGNVRRLRSASLAGGPPQVLTESSDRLAAPVWSPDGKTTAVIGCAGGAPCELRLLNLDGSLRQKWPLAEIWTTNAAWSPDQRWISFTGSPTNQLPRLVAVEVSTGRVVPLGDMSQGAPGTVLWLPDSRGLIVSDVKGGMKDRHIWFRRVDLTGESRPLRDFALGEGPSVAVPIDAVTALVVRSSSHDYRLVSLVEDSPERVILPGVEAGSWAPAFSADRQWLAVRRSPGGVDGSRVNAVELCRTDGSGRVTIELPFLVALGQSSMVILPGAKELIVVESLRQDTDPGVYLVTVATKAVRKLFTFPARPARSGGPEIVVSPDGRTMLYAIWEALAPSVSTIDLATFRQPGRP